ncbi:ornithine cyclodeaminase family protein [Sphingomonas sp.]|uniref:ornithine cyclodeaminase family protein n=1 Tax=Sphingomonas sp. TaxID=28214 RepID=UPI003D6D4FAB
MSAAPVFADAGNVRVHLEYGRCIAAVREAMIALSSGQAVHIPRSVIPLDNKVFALMPGSLGLLGAFGVKAISVVDDPDHAGRQAHLGAVLLFDPVDGRLTCVADAEEITTIRTAAASALATDLLARPDAQTLGIFGSGRQARAHVRAIACVRKLEKVWIWGRTLERATQAAEELARETGLAVEATKDAPQAARADILCTVTTSPTPVVFGEWVLPGAHVNLVGSHRRGYFEVDRALVLRSLYFADSRASVMIEAGEFLEALEAGALDERFLRAEIGQIASGTAAGRTDANEITIYKSHGHAVQDLAATKIVYESMVEQMNKAP